MAGYQYGSMGHSCLKNRGREGVRRGGEEEGERGRRRKGRTGKEGGGSRVRRTKQIVRASDYKKRIYHN